MSLLLWDFELCEPPSPKPKNNLARKNRPTSSQYVIVGRLNIDAIVAFQRNMIKKPSQIPGKIMPATTRKIFKAFRVFFASGLFQNSLECIINLLHDLKNSF
jgi:hypothetical protein